MVAESVIVSIARTPIGSFQGALSSVPTVRLGAVVIKSALERAGIKGSEVDEVIMGNVLSAGEGQAAGASGDYLCRSAQFCGMHDY